MDNVTDRGYWVSASLRGLRAHGTSKGGARGSQGFAADLVDSEVVVNWLPMVK